MEKFKKILKSKYLPFIIFGIILFIIHIPIIKNNDDLWFQNILNEQSITSFSIQRYNNWSSRTIIEAVLIILSNTNVSLFIWKILDILMFELLAYSIYKIFLKGHNKSILLSWILVFGILTIPVSILNGAGWIATTTNYLWPLALGMYVFTIIRKKCNSEKIKWYEAVTYIVATIYATNQEQMAAIMFGIISIYFIYIITKKQVKQNIDISIIVIYLITITNLVIILLCPGNKVRKIQETQNWYPIYETYGVFSKIQLGITSMMRYIIIEGRMVFIIFTGIIAYFMLITDNSVCKKVLGIFPFIGATFVNLFGNLTMKIYPGFIELLNIYNKEELIINSSNVMQKHLYIPILFYLFIMICIIIDLYLIFNNTKKGKFIVIIFLAGLASRIIIGFSPTVFASGERTSFYLYYSFVIIGLLIIKEMIDKKINIKNLSSIYIVMSICNILLTTYN